jgi:glycosyltransferase
MKISVVTACFNSEETIARTIQSFLRQSHEEKEMIVVDGLSRDRTLDVVQSFRSAQVRLISEADAGTYDAMNKGLRLYQGEAVGFLNSDDIYHDDQVLSRIAAALQRADATYGDVLMVSDHVEKRPIRSWRGGEFRAGNFSWGWMPPHPTFYARRELVEKVGFFRLDYEIAADYDFMLRALELNSAKAEYIPHTLVDFMVGGTSTAGWRAIWRNNIECLQSRRQYLGALPIDLALFLKPGRKVFQLHWR